MIDFDLEEERIRQEIAKANAKCVLLQLPEGLKPQALQIAKMIEQTGSLVIVSADPCYGACDIATSEAQILGVDLIIHFGHSKMMRQTTIPPTIYIEARSNLLVESVITQALNLLSGYYRIGLTTSIQHLQTLKSAKKILEISGKEVFIGDKGQMEYAGQVTGCNYSNVKCIAKDVDAFVFVGGGLFHAIGVALATSKPTIVADPYDNRAYNVDKQAQKILKQRFGCIEEAKRAKTFGVLVGIKPGQKHLDTAIRIKSMAKKCGITVFLFSGRDFTPEILLEFPGIDAYVNTACPRISLESSDKFRAPVLTVNEFMVVCGEVSWESLIKKGFFEN
jgi:2-(3-amino-3-carboxypropyl)histidine synthase